MRLKVRIKPGDLTPEQIEGSLFYFGAADDLMDTPFSSDGECLRVWRRHREYLMRVWNELHAAGRVPAGAIPWGLALEQGMSMQQGVRHNSAAKGDKTWNKSENS